MKNSSNKNANKNDFRDKLWAIGGGKGGVGKSIFTIMLGTSLAKLGKKVILVDADLGGSNLHTLAGIRYPLYTLAEFINREVNTLEEVILDTPVDNMQIICGADDILGIANPKYAQKTRIFNALKRLDADFILLDLGAGTSFTAIDFFLYAPNKVVVMTPQATSIQNAYGFIKASLYRKLKRVFNRESECIDLIKRASSAAQGEEIDSIEKLRSSFEKLGHDQAERLAGELDELSIQLVLNMVRGPKEKKVPHIVSTVAKEYLSLDLELLGLVQYDKRLGMSVNNMSRFLLDENENIAKICFNEITNNLLKRYEKNAVRAG